MRHKTLFCFKFTDAKQAEEFKMCWRKLNGSIVPLQDTTNAGTVRTTKQKGNIMVPAVVNGYGNFGLIVEAKLYVPKYIANEDDDSESNAGYTAVVNGYGNFGLIVEAKLYVPKYIANEDDDSESNAGYIEDIIIDKDDAPQSQNWMTAFSLHHISNVKLHIVQYFYSRGL